jgi:hypothetical protein
MVLYRILKKIINIMEWDNLKGYVIHLEERVDRKEIFQKELVKLNIPYDISPGVKSSVSHQGIGQAFKNVIQKAIDEDLEAVWIFEDDLKVTHEDSVSKLKRSFSQLPNDWGIFLGGFFNPHERDLMHGIFGDLIKLRNFNGFHCILVRNTAYKFFMDYNPELDKHIDRYIGRRARMGELNIYGSYPCPVIQYSGVSDNTGRYMDNEDINGNMIFNGW